MKQNTSCNAAPCMKIFWAMLQPSNNVSERTRQSMMNQKPSPHLLAEMIMSQIWKSTQLNCVSLCALIIEISGQSLVSLQLAQGYWAGEIGSSLLEVYKHTEKDLSPWASALFVSGSLGPENKVLCQALHHGYMSLGSPAPTNVTLIFRIHHDGSGLRLEEWRSSWRPTDHLVQPPSVDGH